MVFMAVFFGAPGLVSAQDAKSFPNKPVRIIVAASPGGTSDICSFHRAEADGEMEPADHRREQTRRRQQRRRRNRGQVDAQWLHLALTRREHADHGAQPVREAQLRSAQGLRPGDDDRVLAAYPTAHPPLPANSIKELIAFSKANPGKLNFASSSNATKLAATRLNSEPGMDMLIVPYKGGASAITAVIAGESNIMMASLLSTMSQIKSGKLKPIGVASARRMEATPEIPTLIEGGVANFVTGSWQGLLAPAGTPPDIVKKTNAAVVEVLRTAEMKAKLVGEGAEVVANTPEEFAAFLRDETASWTKVVKDAGIKPE